MDHTASGSSVMVTNTGKVAKAGCALRMAHALSQKAQSSPGVEGVQKKWNPEW